ncbi:MAG: DMT family transporter [Saprospiraceae bacterium]|nr:DMT family transporter [Saprospiraceae bacterium]
MIENKQQSLGIVFALVGSLLFSTKAIFVKLSYQHQIDSISLLLLRMIFALPFYLFMIFRVVGQKWQSWISVKRKYWLALLVAAAMGYYLSSLLDFLGLQYIGASVERLILFIYPTFIAMISFFVFREKVTWLQAGALALSYVGLLFVFGNNLESISFDSHFWRGSFLILGCALTFAVFLVMNQWLIPKFGATSFTSISMAVACLIVIIHFLISQRISGLFNYPPIVYIYALAMATVATVIPSYIVNYAIQRIGATRSAILASVGPISTVSLAYLLLGERLLPAQLIGGILVVAGVTIVSVEMKRKK